MPLPRRRLLFGTLIVLGVVLLGMIIWAGMIAKRTADNITTMIVTPLTLPSPSAAPAPTTPPGTVVAVATPTTAPTSVPTAIPAPDAPLNILLLGTDRRPDQLAGRTDAVLLVRIDPKQKRAALLSFPRDLWVSIPGHGEERINGAYFVGETEIGKGYGPALAKQTVSELVGLPVNHFVMINLEGFAAIVDKLGGVRINVPEAIDDPEFPTWDRKTMRVTFDAGCQTLSGERALQYARTRHQDSDFSRIRRQQQVLSAIYNTVRERGLFAQLTSIDDYTALLKDDITTDLNVPQILSLLQFGAQLTPETVHRYQIDSFKIEMLQEPATFAVDPAELKLLVQQFTGDIPDQPPPPGKGFAPSNAAAVACQ